MPLICPKCKQDVQQLFLVETADGMVHLCRECSGKKKRYFRNCEPYEFVGAVNQRLGQLQKLLVEGYKLTLVARHPTDTKAHIIIGNDSDDDVIAAINELRNEPPIPNPHPIG
jgi:hypothetical protein